MSYDSGMRHPRTFALLAWAGPALLVVSGSALAILGTYAQTYDGIKNWAQKKFEVVWPVVNAPWFITLAIIAFISYIAALVYCGLPRPPIVVPEVQPPEPEPPPPPPVHQWAARVHVLRDVIAAINQISSEQRLVFEEIGKFIEATPKIGRRGSTGLYGRFLRRRMAIDVLHQRIEALVRDKAVIGVNLRPPISDQEWQTNVAPNEGHFYDDDEVAPSPEKGKEYRIWYFSFFKLREAVSNVVDHMQQECGNLDARIASVSRAGPLP